MPSKTPKQAAHMVALKAAGYSLAAIAAQTGVSVSTVQRTLKKYPTVKGEAFEEMIEVARSDFKRSFVNHEGLTEVYTGLISDTVSQVLLGRVKAAELLEQLEASDSESAVKALRGLAAHATAIKAQSDALRALLPPPEPDQVDLPEIVVCEMTDEEVRLLREEQEAEDSLMQQENEAVKEAA